MILDNYNNIIKNYMNLFYDPNISVSENWDNFWDELSDMNQKSNKGFKDYVECYEKTYPIIIEKLASEYQRFIKFFDDFKSDYSHVLLMKDYV